MNKERDLTYVKEFIESKGDYLLFMKGTPEQPHCGFSYYVVQILNENGIKFDFCNVLESPKIRRDLKVYSNWPTYPQLYCKHKLVGGYDIIREAVESDSFLDIIK